MEHIHMKLGQALDELITFKAAIRRQSWKNKRKALLIDDRGGLSVFYETRSGVMAQSGYRLYAADMKAADWVIIPLINSRGSDRLDELQKVLQSRG